MKNKEMKDLKKEYLKWKNKKLKKLWLSSKYPEVNIVIANALKNVLSFEMFLEDLKNEE